jgi:hypothetical protein
MIGRRLVVAVLGAAMLPLILAFFAASVLVVATVSPLACLVAAVLPAPPDEPW